MDNERLTVTFKLAIAIPGLPLVVSKYLLRVQFVRFLTFDKRSWHPV